MREIHQPSLRDPMVPCFSPFCQSSPIPQFSPVKASSTAQSNSPVREIHWSPASVRSASRPGLLQPTSSVAHCQLSLPACYQPCYLSRSGSHSAQPNSCFQSGLVPVS
ncbi:hypothetical protein CRG98_039413 [Punica granatum]|uniref:Uncharacterized protein n=1 Tax=Punica granatum TaxID=22663 RepID=A0A2I0I981_PUNGR|nr:hypothetical protein CRG98_039413 [Punica granatum]